jgi:hypothetical protein
MSKERLDVLNGESCSCSDFAKEFTNGMKSSAQSLALNLVPKAVFEPSSTLTDVFKAFSKPISFAYRYVTRRHLFFLSGLHKEAKRLSTLNREIRRVFGAELDPSELSRLDVLMREKYRL